MKRRLPSLLGATAVTCLTAVVEVDPERPSLLVNLETVFHEDKTTLADIRIEGTFLISRRKLVRHHVGLVLELGYSEITPAAFAVLVRDTESFLQLIQTKKPVVKPDLQADMHTPFLLAESYDGAIYEGQVISPLGYDDMLDSIRQIEESFAKAFKEGAQE